MHATVLVMHQKPFYNHIWFVMWLSCETEDWAGYGYFLNKLLSGSTKMKKKKHSMQEVFNKKEKKQRQRTEFPQVIEGKKKNSLKSGIHMKGKCVCVCPSHIKERKQHLCAALVNVCGVLQQYCSGPRHAVWSRV